MAVTAENIRDDLHTRGELLFAANGAEPPTVVIPAGSGEATRMGGLDKSTVMIADARRHAGTFGLDREGFAFLNAPSAVADFEDEDELVRVYYPEVRRLVAEAVGASEVEIFDHTIRVTDPTSGYRRPASHVHNDYTETSGPKRLADMIGADRAADWLAERVVQINLWRPIAEPVLRMPLALLDASSLGQTDLVETRIINQRQNGRVGLIYSVLNRPGQNWYYFPRMTKAEAILIKGFDTATDGRARFTPHTAFDDPNTPADAPPRRSIEVRTFARVPV